MENRIETEDLLELAVSLGYHLQMCGAEIYRVEEAVTRLLQAYGVPGDVFAIPSCLIVTVCPDDAEPMTRMRRIGYHGTDIDGIERYYALCRKLCREKPPLEDAGRLLQEAKKLQTCYTLPILYLGYFLAAGAFAVHFGGTIPDGILAGLCGVLTGWFLRMLTKLQVNAFFKTITAAFLIAVISQTLTHLTMIRYADATAIGALMLLVPGMTFTDSMRDIIYGDTLSGINKLVQVLLTAAALLLGTGAALRLSRLLWESASIGISLDVPKHAIGRNTVEAMRSGLVYGHAAMIDGLLDRMEEEMGEKLTAIATGGLSPSVAPACRHEIILDKTLLLTGLQVIYEKNV